MEVVFYSLPSGKEPVRKYLKKLPKRDRAAAADVLYAIRQHGLNAPGVTFTPVKGKLWEFRILGSESHRVFYVTVTGPVMVLLHAYKKKTQKIPPKELTIAEKRMKEVLS